MKKNYRFKALRGVFAGIARVFKASGSDVTKKPVGIAGRPVDHELEKFLGQMFKDEERISFSNYPDAVRKNWTHEDTILRIKVNREAIKQRRPILDLAAEYGLKPLTVEQVRQGKEASARRYRQQMKQERRLYKAAVAKLPLHKRIARRVLPHSLRPKVSFKQGSVTHLNR